MEKWDSHRHSVTRQIKHTIRIDEIKDGSVKFTVYYQGSPTGVYSTDYKPQKQTFVKSEGESVIMEREYEISGIEE